MNMSIHLYRSKNICAKSYCLCYFSNIDCCSVLYKFNRVYITVHVCTLTAEKSMVNGHQSIILEFSRKVCKTCSYMTAILKIKAKKIKNIFQDAPRYQTVSCNIPKQLVEPFLRTKSFIKIKRMAAVVAGKQRISGHMSNLVFLILMCFIISQNILRN